MASHSDSQVYRAAYNKFSSQWTPAGRFLYNLTYTWGRALNSLYFRAPFLSNFILYFLNFTWGIITALLGSLIGAAVLLVTFRPPHLWYGIPYFSIVKTWGGLEMGPFFFRDLTSSADYINNHEWGHCFAQTTLLGPLTLFLVTIPSATRYWIHTWRLAHGRTNPDYDNIWFEACATDIGNDNIADRRRLRP